MPITLVKLIDLYAGTALFALLNLFSILPRRRAGSAPPRKILLVKFWGIGSILLLLPVMRALRKAHPQAEITLLTLKRNQGLFSLLPIDRFVTLDLGSTPAVPFRLVGLTAAIVRARYDLVIDCEFYAKLAAILTFASGAPRRVGFYRKERLRRRLYTDGVPFRHDRHVTRAFAELLRPLDIPVNEEDHALAAPSSAAIDEADAIRDELGLSMGNYLVMNVNASELAYERRWPPDRFAELARRIRQQLEIPVILIGAPGERDYVQGVERDAGDGVTSVAGRTTIPGLQALLHGACLFVSNDSGPLHLAAASGVRCAALFGPETPELYGPVGSGHVVFYRQLPCSPCMSVHDMKQVVCHGQIECLRDISVDTVYESIASQLLARPAPAAAPVSVTTPGPAR